VQGIHGVPPEFVRAQIDSVVGDIGADAVKIGMLATPEVVRVVADAIRRHQLRNVVLDPVMVATSGDRLIAPETASVLVRELFPLATVVTPNLDEAALLLGHAIDGVDALDGAVQELLALGAPAALLKGGHLSGDLVVDLLGHGNGQRLRLQSPRIATHNGHGTGCTLSSAIASHLALGLPLEAAVAQAREYILGAIAAGADVFTGAGHGPLNHGYAPRAQVVIG
jgi:hydroxymethylpyrimidine/phosphomethylpyrimidine kinase